MAFQKVMISGVNTAELTVLKEEEKIALLKEIRDTGSKEARDRLIQGNQCDSALCQPGRGHGRLVSDRRGGADQGDSEL